MKKIAIIGITGSIGLSAVEVVKRHPDLFRVALASSHNNAEKLSALTTDLRIDKSVVTGNLPKSKLRQHKTLHPNLLFGQDELFRLLQEEQYDIVINAVAGSAGLVYSHHILKNGHPLALANKESLVLAGHLLKAMKGVIIPVDSEHSALFQIMKGIETRDVKNMILTASGGPFLHTPLDSFPEITPGEALKHPVWSMGQKITIDSATMFNKGLEVIEAHHLFGLEYEQIKAVIHPQSIIHSMVECNDGSILSQMSIPSMQLPILYALSYPEHIVSDLTATNLFELPPLTFSPIDKGRFPLYYLTLEAGKSGGLMPTAINAANEAAIKLFFEGKITFPQIYQIIADYLEGFHNVNNPSLEMIIEANELIFEEVYNAR